jgi:polyferredoxin
MECVSCTQCIDACNDIMHKIGKPGGLIRYASEREIEDGESSTIFRPRVIAYSILLVALLGAFGFMLSNAEGVEVDVLRKAGTTFERQTIDQTPMIRSRIRFRVRNKLDSPQSFSFEVNSPEGTELKIIGPPSYRLDVNEMKRVEAFVFVPESAYAGRTSVDGTFSVLADGEEKKTVSIPLPGPEPNSATSDSTPQ